jgi:hypothetical protein
MSLHHAAQHLKAQGRGPDDQLIHMSGKEVAGLQALAMAHGGTLTINPETGLPEAGFLDDILPTVIGAAGMYFGIDPMTTAAIMGGGTALQTGDLGKGLMAGLGAYGGGSMMQSALGSGAASAAANAAGYTPEIAAGTPLSEVQGLTSAGNTLTNADKLAAFNPSVAGVGGYKNIAMAAAPAIMGAMQPGAAPAAAQDRGMIRPYEFSYNAQTPKNPPPLGTQYQPGQDTSERMWFKPSYTALPPYRAAGGGLMGIANDPSAPVRMFASGGLSDLTRMVTGEDVMPMDREKQMAMGGIAQAAEQLSGGAPTGSLPAYSMDEGMAAYIKRMQDEGRLAAGGAISTLGGYAAGGNPRLLKGPGDGMSDNIPAVIGGKQPARLADGEFVVPADVVSHLGNGSTDAGAKQLYKMMDRVRQSRTGKKKQAPQVNPAKAMPA